MKLDACDLCHENHHRLVAGETMVMSVDGISGEIDLCGSCRSELQNSLVPFLTVSRIASGGTRRCPECGYMSASKEAASKHARMHAQARERQRQLQQQRSETIPSALVATG